MLRQTNQAKKLCPVCHEDEVYSEQLTKGLCLNCYQVQQEEFRKADIEAEHDYEQGCGF